jgi:HAMP domain-containing protein
LYKELRARSQKVVQTVAKDEELAIAVRDGDRAALQNRLEDLAQRGGAVRVRLTLEGQEPIEAGGGEAVAPAVSRIIDADGHAAGRMSLSVSTAEDYADLLARVTGLEVLLTQGDRIIDGTIETGSARDLPLRGEAEVEGEKYRLTGFETPSFDGGPLGVHVLIPEDELDDAVSENAFFIGVILVAFLICALAFALTAARSLQSQIERLLNAARTIGKGDFSIEVPTEGNDEFAALGKEFNSMARQL